MPLPELPPDEKPKRSLVDRMKKIGKIGILATAMTSPSVPAGQSENAGQEVKEWRQERITVGTHTLPSYDDWVKEERWKPYVVTREGIIRDGEEVILNIEKELAEATNHEGYFATMNPATVKEIIAKKQSDIEYIKQGIAEAKKNLENPIAYSYSDYINEYGQVYKDFDAQRDWVKKNIETEEYKRRLAGELNSESAGEELQKMRLERVDKTPYVLEEGWIKEGAGGKYDPEKDTVTLGSGTVEDGTGLHEYTHASTRSNMLMSQKAADLYTKSFNDDGFKTNGEYFESAEYFNNPTERHARKKHLEYDMEKLGVKKYDEPFTPLHYKKLLDLLKEGKLSKDSEEFIRMTKPEYMEQIMNEIADASLPDTDTHQA